MWLSWSEHVTLFAFVFLPPDGFLLFNLSILFILKGVEMLISFQPHPLTHRHQKGSANQWQVKKYYDGIIVSTKIKILAGMIRTPLVRGYQIRNYQPSNRRFKQVVN